jgi:hypothetical protein
MTDESGRKPKIPRTAVAKSDRTDPLAIANAAGFAFQLAVEEAVIQSSGRHEWESTSREHGWRDEDDTPRFIDLILTKDTIHLVIE